jgi:hypothetical protein
MTFPGGNGPDSAAKIAGPESHLQHGSQGGAASILCTSPRVVSGTFKV